MRQPNDSVRIVLFDSSDNMKFLILTEADDALTWKLPGGKFDSNDEAPDRAATRELLEELQVKLKLEQVGKLTNDDGVSIRYIYSGAVDPKEVNPSTEVAKVQWVSKDRVPEGPNKNHIFAAVQFVQTNWPV